MKTKVMLIAFAAMLISAIPSVDAIAQRGKMKNGGPRPDCPRFEDRTQFRNYCQTEMLPKLEELKKELDGKLNKTDLEKLNELRKNAAELRQQAMKYRSEKHPRNFDKRPSYEERQKFRKEMEQHRQKMQAIFEEVDKLIEKNKWILQDIEPKLDKIMPEPPDAPRPERPDMFNGAPDRMRLHRGMDIERFMLWDGSNFFEKNNPMWRPSAFGQVVNNPNPFTDKTTIVINSNKAQKARVNLFDINGEFIAEIFNGKLNEGKNEIPFSASSVKNMKTGSYYYIVTMEDGAKLEGKMIYGK